LAIRGKAYLESAKKVSAMDEFSQDFLITAIESSYDGIYITDGNANTIMVNKSYEAINGLDRAEVLDRNMRDLVKEGVISQSGTLLALESGRAVTTSRTDVDYVVTEYGIAHLKGHTLRERALALIAIAHPDFRESLRREFEKRFGCSY